eukprot:TRINITY_DN15603_c0_g1_i2.p1 TRINITY_DN15603_c0_g1~~TRINITY_DN15603_c0_g1_i2.p1  ORF type:complete len:241 (+),score=41.83 TRINITY_DN15603_c0_g1_i2:63-785(+)
MPDWQRASQRNTQPLSSPTHGRVAAEWEYNGSEDSEKQWKWWYGPSLQKPAALYPAMPSSRPGSAVARPTRAASSARPGGTHRHKRPQTAAPAELFELTLGADTTRSARTPSTTLWRKQSPVYKHATTSEVKDLARKPKLDTRPPARRVQRTVGKQEITELRKERSAMRGAGRVWLKDSKNRISQQIMDLKTKKRELLWEHGKVALAFDGKRLRRRGELEVRLKVVEQELAVKEEMLLAF